jgi:hypothetical protein
MRISLVVSIGLFAALASPALAQRNGDTDADDDGRASGV